MARSRLTIGEIIRARRSFAGYSLTSFAKKLGMSTSALSRVELGHQQVTAQQIQKIAAALELKPADLFPESLSTKVAS